MILVCQRVSSASVSVDSEKIAEISSGLLVLVGVERGESPEDHDVVRMARKLAELRIFDDAHGVMNRSLKDIAGRALLVSQFTLMASTSKGRRPSWNAAAPGAEAEPVFNALVSALNAQGVLVQTGAFGTEMQVSLVNDGPVTIILPGLDELRTTGTASTSSGTVQD